jgi:acyl-CoA synthetase (AMP-forming)/AMP-acid ligase II
LTQDDRGLAVLPFFHINAPVVSLCATLLAGSTVVVAPRFSRSRFWDWIARHQVTWASVVPTIVALLLQADGPEPVPDCLRFIRTASAPLPAAHLEAFEHRFGVPLIETYGLSEAASTVAANPVAPGVHKAGSVGLPAGVGLRICVPADAECLPLVDVSAGTEGEICIHGPSVIAGYEEGADSQSFVEGWFRTGDLGYRDADGYIFLTGRLRDVINHGGHKVSPREVEETLLAYPDVSDVAVVGQDDPLYGQRVVAYVVPRGDATASDSALGEALRAHCAAQLSAYKVPSEFVCAAALPRTLTGKVQRHILASGSHSMGGVDAFARVSA